MIDQKLLRRLAARTGHQPPYLSRLLSLPRNTGHGPCLTWTGAHSKQTPIISYEGRLVPVRSLTVGYQSRVHCGNPLCIAPAHCSTHLDRLLAKDGISLENLTAEYGKEAICRTLSSSSV